MRDDIVKDFYTNHYDQVFWCGFPGIGMKSTHRAIERNFTSKDTFEVVCEVGAGGQGHLSFVQHQFSKYFLLDLRPLVEAPEDPRVTGLVGDATQLPFADGSLDRVLSMCLLHHLERPGSALEDWRRAMKPGGVVSIFLPCDPGFLVRTNRRLFMNPILKKRGFHQYMLLNSIEHRNHVSSLKAMIMEVFKNDDIQVKRFPLNWLPSWNFNVFMIFQITISMKAAT